MDLLEDGRTEPPAVLLYDDLLLPRDDDWVAVRAMAQAAFWHLLARRGTPPALLAVEGGRSQRKAILGALTDLWANAITEAQNDE